MLFISCKNNIDTIEPTLTTLKEENYRPTYHYTPEKHWMNDPNGMVYYKGEYHLFYQYYPEGNQWGPMHWGHAISTDLIQWEELPIALYPDNLGYIFSGSAVVDKENTSGFKTGEEDVLVAIFTHHEPVNNKEYQSLAYSNDKGRTWSKYFGNPVLTNSNKIDFRDPKVSWNSKVNKWIMSVAAGNEIMFYSSPNLKDWNYLSSFGSNIGAHGGVWECPDLFPIKLDNGIVKWVLIVSINPGGINGGSATQYFIGEFDGVNFTTDQTDIKWLDYGTDNYAGVTWSNTPDNTNLFIGWMSNWNYAGDVPTYSWRSAMTIPRSLHLLENNEGYVLASKPLTEHAEHENLFQSKYVEIKTPLNSYELNNDEVLSSSNFNFKVLLDFSNINSSEIKWGNNTSFIKIKYDKNKSLLTIDRSNAGYNFNNMNNNIINCDINIDDTNSLDLNIWADKSSIEIFVNGGERVVTSLIFPRNKFSNISIKSEEEFPFIKSLSLSKLSLN